MRAEPATALRRRRSSPGTPTTAAAPDHGLDDLVARAVAGDRAALEAVLRIVRPLVVRYCAARLGRGGEVDDVAQEVCLAVLGALPRYRDQGRPFLAFVYAIAAHKVVDAWRGAGRRPEPTDASEDRADPDDGPEMLALRREGRPGLARLIDGLPEGQREVLRLRVVVGLSAAETADAVGSTPGAVRVAQHRALTTLRAALGSDPVTSGPTGDPDLDALLADAEIALRELG